MILQVKSEKVIYINEIERRVSNMKKAKSLLAFELITEKIISKLHFKMSEEHMETIFKVENTYDTVQKLQSYTKMLYENLTRVGAPDVLPLSSFSLIQKRLETQQVLEAPEILQILALFQNVQRVHDFYEKNKKNLVEVELLEELLQAMIENKELIKEIKQVMSEHGTILDTASQQLMEIRESQRKYEQSIRSTLQDIMHTSSSKMSENFYTLRNNRYVLPIKAEFGNTFKGILHDQSASNSTFYIEPQALVLLNNKLQEKKVEERQEIERILFQICQQIYAVETEIQQNIWQLSRYDIFMAKAEYAFLENHTAVTITNNQEIKLYDAKHPLLSSQQAIGNNVLLGKDFQVLMITGANTGGKSVFLKTVGLLVMMAQSGLFLPVDQNEVNTMGIFSDVLIDIGDEQSLEQNLSTFSAHITNIKAILEQASPQTLILLDELGSGTDPLQGSALSIAIIEQLHRIGTYVVATTHYNEVKEFIAKQTYAFNAAMSFNQETLKPTYQIRYGSYGASYAFDIATALELPQEIIASARKHAETIGDDTQQLLTIYEQRLEAVEKSEKEVKQLRLDLLKQKEKIEHQEQVALRQLERERQQILAKTEKEMVAKLKQANELIETLKEKKSLKHNESANIKGQLNILSENNKEQIGLNKPKEKINYREGDIVYIERLQSNGTLFKKNKDKWTVKVGMLSTTVFEDDMQLVKSKPRLEKKPVRTRKTVSRVESQVDLRGMRVYDAIEKLDQYLANASANHDIIRIIHGHGTGSMRQAVQEFLKKQPNIKSFRFGGEGEGGVGATVVEFK